ncbi:MAG: hypothetical protein JXQ30_05855 [Spirochaetes bacterium]|nr:hypothetical protein [Spirochaetota bacterium]
MERVRNYLDGGYRELEKRYEVVWVKKTMPVNERHISSTDPDVTVAAVMADKDTGLPGGYGTELHDIDKSHVQEAGI